MSPKHVNFTLESPNSTIRIFRILKENMRRKNLTYSGTVKI